MAPDVSWYVQVFLAASWLCYLQLWYQKRRLKKIVMWYHQNKLYSWYLTEACYEWRGPSSRFDAWSIQLRRNIQEIEPESTCQGIELTLPTLIAMSLTTTPTGRCKYSGEITSINEINSLHCFLQCFHGPVMISSFLFPFPLKTFHKVLMKMLQPHHILMVDRLLLLKYENLIKRHKQKLFSNYIKLNIQQ